MNLEIFKNADYEIRVAVKENEPLFCLSDVCRILEIQDTNGVKNAIDREFDKGGRFNLTPLQTAGGMQNFIMITEPELYFVLMRSDKPNAKPFRLWVNSEVLPAIRKHGGYLTPQKIDEVLSDPDTIIKLATDLKAERAKRKELEQREIINLPYVSFAKSVEASIDGVLIGNYAKMLSESEGISIGQNKLFQWLRDNGYLIATKGERFNMPFQRHVDNGYFEVTTTTFAGTNGTHQRFTTKITGKGQIALAGKIVDAFKGNPNA
ncbi:phage antirepressor KilAC domain-containing protein [Campylobacter sp. RM16191]|uniref:phage antirepressor n=1 Tax=Campylobacter sp. RM16191 TaxID=1705728 RepID=UPI0014741470|nr:phage antirepressor KilAC domain-containing protein [Campylobacter sp. RM16191]